MLASDNASGVHPRVLQWLAKCNGAHVLAYGADPYTRQVEAQFRDQFGPDSSVLMMTTGTATNVLCLQALARSIDTVFCSDRAHLMVDECGAPENVIGCKLVGVKSHEGKIQLDALAQAVAFQTDLVHRNLPRVLSLSQATEYGTVYSMAELKALTDFARDKGLKIHMDGSRIANAAVALDVSLAALTREMGVDLLSFGGTKNGLMMAEAIVNFDSQWTECLPAIRKQGVQLVSKQRFLAAQFLAYFEEDLWLQNAAQANRMATLLANGLSRFAAIKLSAPVEINMVFARIPQRWIAPLQQHTYFNIWDPDVSEVRFVTSFDTTEQDVAAFIDAVAQLVKSSK